MIELDEETLQQLRQFIAAGKSTINQFVVHQQFLIGATRWFIEEIFFTLCLRYNLTPAAGVSAIGYIILFLYLCKRR